MYKKLVWILAFILLALIADRIIFTSADIKITMNPEVLRASVNSEIKLSVYRVNVLGFKVPFSTMQAQYVIEDGKNLVELADTGEEGTVIIRSKGVEGEAEVGIYAVKTGLQIKKILIKVLPRDLALLID